MVVIILLKKRSIVVKIIVINLSDKPIILYGIGSNEKSHLLQEINIDTTDYIIKDGYSLSELQPLNNKLVIIATNCIDDLDNISPETYYLINMNSISYKK